MGHLNYSTHPSIQVTPKGRFVNWKQVSMMSYENKWNMLDAHKLYMYNWIISFRNLQNAKTMMNSINIDEIFIRNHPQYRCHSEMGKSCRYSSTNIAMFSHKKIEICLSVYGPIWLWQCYNSEIHCQNIEFVE